MLHGTVSLFAALEVHSGKFLTRCAPRDISQSLVEFLDETLATHRRKTGYVIFENLAVHKSPAVKALAAAHPETQFHFTPTDFFWPNQAGIRLCMITRDCIPRGIPRSRKRATKSRTASGSSSESLSPFAGPIPIPRNVSMCLLPREKGGRDQFPRKLHSSMT